MSQKQGKQSNKQTETYVPTTVQSFRQVTSLSIPLLNFLVPFKKVQDNYIIYRNKNWQQHQQFKTIISLSGNAYVNFNPVNADVIYPGMISDLPSDVQLILALYPNAPENKFPAPVKHLQATISNLIDKSNKYQIDLTNMIFSGYSCGGTMMVPLSLYFLAKQIQFKSLLFISPIFDYSLECFQDVSLSSKWQGFQKKDNTTLNYRFIEFMNSIYSNNKADLLHPMYSPYFTPPDELNKLYNPCFIYGENDFIRRSIQSFKVKLTDLNVKHESHILKDQGHLTMVMVKKRNATMEKQVQERLKSIKLQTLREIGKYLKKILN